MEDRSASVLGLKALRVPRGNYDVAVLGGGRAAVPAVKTGSSAL